MSRRAWFWLVAGYAAMALGFTVVSFVLADHVDQIKRTQRQIRSTQRQLATIAVHNAGAICLGLTAPTKQEEIAIVDAFLKGGGTIVAQFTPRCAQVAERAAKDIFDGDLPAGLQAQLERAAAR